MLGPRGVRRLLPRGSADTEGTKSGGSRADCTSRGRTVAREMPGLHLSGLRVPRASLSETLSLGL